MKSAIIFGNGEIKNYKRIKKILIESLRLRSGKTLFPEQSVIRTSIEEQQRRTLRLGSGKTLFPEQAKHFEGFPKTNLIICADGGARHAVKLGLIPDVVIGDMDSISLSIRNKLKKNPDIKWIEHPAEKDATDSQLAIDYAIKKKYQSLTLCGFTGGRTDHFLATLFYLSTLNLSCVEIISEKETMYVVNNKFVLKGDKGLIFSLIPLRTNIEAVTLEGAKYPLNFESLKFGSTRGVSNEFAGNTLFIKCKHTTPLLVVAQN